MQIATLSQKRSFGFSILIWGILSFTGCSRGGIDIPVPLGDQIAGQYGDRAVTAQDVLIAFQEKGNFDALIAPDPIQAASQTVMALMKDHAFNSYLADKAKEAGLEQKPAVQEYRENVIKDELYQKVLLEDVLKPLKVAEEDIRRYYDENRSTLFLVKSSNVFIARGIYVLKEKRTREQAQALIQEAYEKVKKGISFESVAIDYSDAPLNLRGKPSPLPIGSLAPETVDRLMQLKDGEYTDIIEMDKGFYIYQRVEHRPPKSVPIEEVTDTIRLSLTKKQTEQAIFLLSDKLRQKHNLVLRTDLLAKDNIQDPSTYVLDVPNVYRLTYGEFQKLTGPNQSPQEKQQYLQLLGQKAVYLAEAYSRGWTEEDVAPTVDFWMTYRLAEEYIRSQLGTINEEEIRRIYEDNKENEMFFTPALYDLSHLFFQVPSSLSLSRYEQMALLQRAESLAKQALQEIRQGRPFDEVVVMYSQDSNAASNGGHLGHKALNSLDAYVQDAVSPLKEGQIGNPQRINSMKKDRYGYEIFYVRDIVPPQPLSYEEARILIGRTFAQNQFSEKVQQFLEEFESQHPEQLNTEALQSIYNYLVTLSKHPDWQADIARYEEPQG